MLGLTTGFDIQERAFIQISLISHPVISPERYFRRARIIFDLGNAIRIAILADSTTDTGHNATHCNLPACQSRLIFQICHTGIADVIQHNRELIQRMGGKVDTYQVAFLVQTFEVAPALYSLRYFGGGDIDDIRSAEQ